MKVKHVLMIAAVLLAMLVMPVAAEITQDSLTQSGQLSVTELQAVKYIVTIPDSVQFNQEAIITASEVVLNPEDALKVTVSSGNDGWNLVHKTSGDTHPYGMYIKGTSTPVAEGASVLTISSSDEASVVLTFAKEGNLKKAGTWTDTLTFTVGVETNGASAVTDVYISTPEGLIDALKAGGNYKLAKDIDLAGVDWPFIKNAAPLVLDGQGYAIKNLNVIGSGTSTMGACAGLLGQSYSSVTFKNINMVDATLNPTDHNIAGVFIGDGEGVITFEGCHITGASVDSKYAAGFIGYSQVTSSITIEDCSVTGSTFSGTSAAAALVGLVNSWTTSFTISNVEVTGNTIDIDGNNGHSAAALVGTNNCGCIIAATDVVVSGNTYTGTTDAHVTDATYGQMYIGSGSLSINGELYFLGSTPVDLKAALASSTAEDVVVKLCADTSIDGNRVELGNANTQSISIDGGDNKNKLTLTTTYESALGLVNPLGTLYLKNLEMTSTGNKHTTWNGYDICFWCNVDADNVDFLKAVALDNPGKKSVLNYVTIKETRQNPAVNALWIVTGTDVMLTNCEITVTTPNNGAGIAIKNQYQADLTDETKVSISDTTIETTVAHPSIYVTTTNSLVTITLSNVQTMGAGASFAPVGLDPTGDSSKVSVTGGTTVVTPEGFVY